MPTLNFSGNNDFIIPSNNGITYRGLAGNDTYILSENTIVANAKITIVDTIGITKIQLVDGLLIASSIFAANAVQFTLSNGSVITINGANNFVFAVGGNATAGIEGSEKTFSEFASSMGVSLLPTSGSTSGVENIKVDGTSIIQDLPKFKWEVSVDASTFYNIIDISASADGTVNATDNADDFRYEINNNGVSAEGPYTINISGFDATNDKLTLVNKTGSTSLTTQEFDSLANVEVTSDGISGTQILFAPDSDSQSGKLVLPNVEETFSGDWTATTYTVEIIPKADLDEDQVIYYPITEGKSVTVTITSDKKVLKDTIIEVYNGNSDDHGLSEPYNSDKKEDGSYPSTVQVIMKAGTQEVSFQVLAKSDEVVEGTQKINVKIYTLDDSFTWDMPDGLSPTSAINFKILDEASSSASPTYTLTKSATSVDEGSSVTFTITASSAVTADTQFSWTVIGSDNGGTVDKATSADLSAQSGTATIASGGTSTTFTVSALTDSAAEGNEGFEVTVLDPNSATFDSGSQIVFINNVDLKGTSSDDDLTLTDGDDVFEVTTGLDSIDGGAGEDTVVVPSGTTIYHAVNTRGESFYGNEIGDKFLFINLEGEGLWTKSTFATNFEYIQIKGEDTKTAISDYNAFSYFDVRSSNNDTEGVAIANQVIADNTETTINLDDNFFTLNANASLSYTVSFSNDKITDQITVSGSNLSFKGGTGGDTYEVSVTVRATQTLPGDVTIADSDMYEENTFTVTISDDDYVAATTGTSSDDNLTLTDGDDIFTVTKGRDKIDGGEGIDTLVISSEDLSNAFLTYSNDVKGYRTDIIGKDYVYIKIGDESGKFTTAINFEKIQTPDGTWNIEDFDYSGYTLFGPRDDIANQSLSNNSIKEINIKDILWNYTHPTLATVSYSFTSDNDKLTDQITLTNGILEFTAGSVGESYETSVTVTAKLVDGKINVNESNENSSISKTFIVTMTDDDFVEGQTGTSSDDIITLTSGDDVFEVTKGSDKINAGAGSDTILVPEGTKIISAVDARGKSIYTGEEGKSFLYIELKDDSTADGYASDYTVATNFEKIQIKGESTTTLLTDYLSLWRWDVVNDVDITNQSVSDNSEKTINLSDNFYTDNANATLNYTISFSNDKVTDQISVSGSSLLIQGGVGGDTYNIEVTVRATQTFSDNFSFSTDTFNYEEDTFTITISDDDYVAVNASSDTTPSQTDNTTISVTEDIPGGVLLDLTSLNIDSGTAKLSTWAWGSPTTLYNAEGFSENFIYIDNKVLKLKDGAWFDVDRSEFIGSDGGYYQNVTDGHFQITFSYKTNGVSKEHEVTITEFIDTPYGFGLYSDGSYADFTEDDDYRLITASGPNALESGRYWTNTKDNLSEIVEIFYSFIPDGFKYIDETEGLDSFYQSDDSRDKIIDPTAEFKNAVYDIFSMISQFLMIKFTELTGDDIEKSTIRFVTWETTADTPFAGYADYPSHLASYVFITAKDDYEKGTYAYETILHEIGHALGLKHPFDETANFEKISPLYNSLQYSVMAYESVFNTIVTNPYDVAEENTVSVIKDADTGNTVGMTHWSMLDLSALGTHYGIKADYNVGDNVYTFEGTSTFTVIHDMGGYDTIDLSNWSNDNDIPEKIDLGGGAFFQVGSSKLIWRGDDVYTGQVVTTSLYTEIEKFIGSSGDDRVIAGPTTDNISTGSGSDITINLTTSITVDLGADQDYAYITIDNTDQINSSININGGSGSGYDYLIVKFVSVDTIDLTLFRTHFDNFEIYSFEDSKSQEITIDINDFITLDEGMILGIIGDEDDKAILPEGATQTNSDDNWLYYTLNDVQIAISDEMLIG